MFLNTHVHCFCHWQEWLIQFFSAKLLLTYCTWPVVLLLCHHSAPFVGIYTLLASTSCFSPLPFWQQAYLLLIWAPNTHFNPLPSLNLTFTTPAINVRQFLSAPACTSISLLWKTALNDPCIFSAVVKKSIYQALNSAFKSRNE